TWRAKSPPRCPKAKGEKKNAAIKSAKGTRKNSLQRQPKYVLRCSAVCQAIFRYIYKLKSRTKAGTEQGEIYKDICPHRYLGGLFPCAGVDIRLQIGHNRRQEFYPLARDP